MHAAASVVPTRDQRWRYFVDQLGWGENAQVSRLSFDLIEMARLHCSGGAILDAGAGHQRYRPLLEPECLYVSLEHPSGVEAKGMQGMSYDMIAELDQRIPLADNCLPGILSTSVMEHIRHPEAFLAEAHRILEPGGRLFISVPFTYVEHEAPHDYTRPTRYALDEWCTDAGFASVAVSPGSSSITASVAFVEMALEDDLRSHGEIERHDEILAAVRPALKLLRDEGDRVLNRDSRLPIGWLAVAVKGGAAPIRLGEAPDRATFLREHLRW